MDRLWGSSGKKRSHAIFSINVCVQGKGVNCDVTNVCYKWTISL